MKAPLRTLLIVITFAGFATGGSLFAQWTMVAQNLVTPFIGFRANPEHGAIHFNDGVLWAGWTKDISSTAIISFSTDTGRTWQMCNVNLTAGDITDSIITDINFYDRMNGLFSTLNGGVFLTRDGGQTWKLILFVPQCISVAFNGSPNIIHALTVGAAPPPPVGEIHTSMDGGLTWSTSSPGGDFCQSFTIARDRTIYSLNSSSNTSGLPGFISFSNDFGKTWKQSATEVDGDSYTICADSCDAQRLYVSNEDYTNTFNDLSELYYSPDAGKSWVSSVAFATPYLCGGMTCTGNTIYASSLRQGIYRSIDKALTWKNIGGPFSLAFDSRNIACVNDNIIFVLDADGSIWKTVNSGGDSLQGLQFNDLVLSQNTLFSSDTLFVCDTSITQYFHIQRTGCIPPSLVKLDLLGGASLSYVSIPLAGDSIGVKFLPVFDSLNAATLVLTLSDGRQKIVTLSGYGIPRLPLVILAPDQVADTLGGEISIPTILNGLQKQENITLVIHYDTVLNYKGSFSTAGVQLDIPGEQWKGRSKLRINGATTGATLGFAKFDVFNDSVPIQHVKFDSVTVLSAISICQYISPSEATSTVTPLSGCGVATISKFLHYGKMPELSIQPNPTNGGASITSSMDLGEVNVIIYDMLGVEQSRTVLTLRKNLPAKLSLSMPNGVYDVRVNSLSGSCDLRIVVSK